MLKSSDLARPAGFEPATRCLEGSCSVRLSYGRPEISVAGEYHASATYGSQCVATSTPRNPVYEHGVPVMSVKELAQHLGEPQAKLYRHVKQLEPPG